MTIFPYNIVHLLTFFAQIIILITSFLVIKLMLHGEIHMSVIPENISAFLMLDMIFIVFCICIYFIIIYFRRIIIALIQLNKNLSYINELNQHMSTNLLKRGC